DRDATWWREPKRQLHNIAHFEVVGVAVLNRAEMKEDVARILAFQKTKTAVEILHSNSTLHFFGPLIWSDWGSGKRPRHRREPRPSRQMRPADNTPGVNVSLGVVRA